MEEKITFRNDIQGLRALAVMLVVFFHAGFDNIQGGFIGVDIFFVISGYLISSKIIEKDFTFGEFYWRRIRRLFPALLAVVLLTVVGFGLILMPYELLNLAKKSIYAIFSLINVEYFFSSNYWSPDAKFEPLLHMWSLSVEEQFYLFWPLLLVILKRKLTLKALAYFMFALTILGVVIANEVYENNPEAAFYLTPFRIFEFSIGALAYLVEGKFQRFSSIQKDIIAFICVILMIGSGFFFHSNMNVPGYTALIPTISAAILIITGVGPFMGRVLANSVTVFIGRISYSVYLVHWPISAAVTYLLLRDLYFYEKISIVGSSLLLGWVLFLVIENRMRTTFSGGNGKIIYGMILALALTLISIFLSEGWTWRYSGNAASMNLKELDIKSIHNERYSELEIQCYKNRFSCFNMNEEKLNIIILGDSHGVDGYNIFKTLYPKANIILGATDGCDAYLNPAEMYQDEKTRGRCVEDANKIYGSTQLFSKIDMVVFSHSFRLGQDKFFVESVDYIRQHSTATIVMLGNSPIYRYPLPNIIFDDQISQVGKYGSVVNSEVMLSNFWELEESIEKLASDNRVIYVSKVDFFCPNKNCRVYTYDGEELNTFDKHHLSYRAAKEFGEYLRKKNINHNLIPEIEK